MKNKIEDLRDHLFETIEALKDPDNPMDIERARAVNELGGTLVDSAKVEVAYLKEVGELLGADLRPEVQSRLLGSGFIPEQPRKPLGIESGKTIGNGSGEGQTRQ